MDFHHHNNNIRGIHDFDFYRIDRSLHSFSENRRINASIDEQSGMIYMRKSEFGSCFFKFDKENEKLLIA